MSRKLWEHFMPRKRHDPTRLANLQYESLLNFLSVPDKDRLRNLYHSTLNLRHLSCLDQRELKLKLYSRLSEQKTVSALALKAARWLLLFAADEELLELAVVLTGILGSTEDLPQLALLVRRSKLTTKAALAYSQLSPDPEQALFALARSFRSGDHKEEYAQWKVVKLLENVRDTSIQDWLLYLPGKSDCYESLLALPCARGSRLLERLTAGPVGGDVLSAALATIRSMCTGTYYHDDGLDLYEHTPQLLSAVLERCSEQKLTLDNLVDLSLIIRFYDDLRDKDKHFTPHWSEADTLALEPEFKLMLSSPQKQGAIEEALKIFNRLEQWQQAALLRLAHFAGVDTFDMQWNWLISGTRTCWYLIRSESGQRREMLLDQARRELPILLQVDQDPSGKGQAHHTNRYRRQSLSALCHALSGDVEEGDDILAACMASRNYSAVAYALQATSFRDPEYLSSELEMALTHLLRRGHFIRHRLTALCMRVTWRMLAHN